MDRDLYEELRNAEFKPITFRLFNKIDDDMIPSYLNKKNNDVYGIDDFEYYKIPLSQKEQFLLSLHNKEMMNSIKKLKLEIENKDCFLDINYKDKEINAIKTKKCTL